MKNEEWLYRRLKVALLSAPLVGACGSAQSNGGTSEPDSEQGVVEGEDANTSSGSSAGESNTTQAGTTDGPMGGQGVSAADLANGADPDADLDGLFGAADECPTEPEDMDGWVDDDGCPDLDNDQDGIEDVADDCPNDWGEDWNNGCPDYEPQIMIGRPLVADEGIVRASLRRGADWTLNEVSSEPTDEMTLGARAWLARRWREDGRLEHASVASFARASLELMSLGAPPELVADYHQAAIDEVRHAERCFAHAVAYDGEQVSPGALSPPGPRQLSLAELAVRAFKEGCVEETVATVCAQAQLAGCRLEEARTTLEMIVDDEANHAAIAWRTVAWALASGGTPVRNALRRAADEERKRFVALAPTDSSDEPPAALLHDHGRITALEEVECAKRAWTNVLEPLLADVLA